MFIKLKTAYSKYCQTLTTLSRRVFSHQVTIFRQTERHITKNVWGSHKKHGRAACDTHVDNHWRNQLVTAQNDRTGHVLECISSVLRLSRKFMLRKRTGSWRHKLGWQTFTNGIKNYSDIWSPASWITCVRNIPCNTNDTKTRTPSSTCSIHNTETTSPRLHLYINFLGFKSTYSGLSGNSHYPCRQPIFYTRQAFVRMFFNTHTFSFHL